jgi:hypothetical protein
MKESSPSGARCGEEIESARESWGIMGRLWETNMRLRYKSGEYWYSLFFENVAEELTKFLVLFHIVNLRITSKPVKVVLEWQVASFLILITSRRPTNMPEVW